MPFVNTERIGYLPRRDSKIPVAFLRCRTGSAKCPRNRGWRAGARTVLSGANLEVVEAETP
ncbi:MAG: hypothetical protein H8F28_04005 [Fibrella sp.]|nr:hypothetical protein [Armatimonadota bacterium]